MVERRGGETSLLEPLSVKKKESAEMRPQDRRVKEGGSARPRLGQKESPA